jgi:hypothetical protein
MPVIIASASYQDLLMGESEKYEHKDKNEDE